MRCLTFLPQVTLYSMHRSPARDQLLVWSISMVRAVRAMYAVRAYHGISMLMTRRLKGHIFKSTQALFGRREVIGE